MAGPHRWIAQTPSSWSAASFDTNLLPANNEKVVFDGTGQGSVIGGLNQAAVDLDLLQVDPEYTGNIGQTGNPLIISADEVVYQGGGSMWYQDGSGITDLMIVESANYIDAVSLSGATITRLRTIDGRVNILPNFTGIIAKLEIDPGVSNFGAYVDVFNGSTCSVTDAYVTGGVLNANEVHLFPGATINVVMLGGIYYTIYGIEFNANFVVAGGAVVWSGFSAAAGSTSFWNGNLLLLGGVFDARPGGPKSILNLYQWNNAEFLYVNGKMTVTTTHRMTP